MISDASVLFSVASAYARSAALAAGSFWGRRTKHSSTNSPLSIFLTTYFTYNPFSVILSPSSFRESGRGRKHRNAYPPGFRMHPALSRRSPGSAKLGIIYPQSQPLLLVAGLPVHPASANFSARFLAQALLDSFPGRISTGVTCVNHRLQHPFMFTHGQSQYGYGAGPRIERGSPKC